MRPIELLDDDQRALIGHIAERLLLELGKLKDQDGLYLGLGLDTTLPEKLVEFLVINLPVPKGITLKPQTLINTWASL